MEGQAVGITRIGGDENGVVGELWMMALALL